MKIKDLIDELSKFDPNLDVYGKYSYTDHSVCGASSGGYCYCSPQDIIKNIYDVDLIKLNSWDKSYKKDIKGIVLSLD